MSQEFLSNCVGHSKMYRTVSPSGKMLLMTRAEKTEHLRHLYGFACGYCGVTEAEHGLLTRDHFKPLTCQGRDSVDNMVYACADCNRAKGDYFSESSWDRLLHPRNDDLREHLLLERDGIYCALSQLGAVYVRVLDLNRPACVALRRERST